MAATDARPIPRKNAAYRVTFPIFDADGDLVSGAAGLDSEVSLDGAAFADCTNEATEIATASGVYFIDLTAVEMNADTVAVIVKTTTPGAKTTPIVLYPEEAGDVRVNVTQWNGNAAQSGVDNRPAVDVEAVSGSVAAADNVEASVTADGVVLPDDAITGPKIAADAAVKIAAAVMAAGDIDGFSLEEIQKIIAAAVAGILKGAATDTNTMRAVDDSKDRITATTDAAGNRTVVVLDATG